MMMVLLTLVMSFFTGVARGERPGHVTLTLRSGLVFGYTSGVRHSVTRQPTLFQVCCPPPDTTTSQQKKQRRMISLVACSLTQKTKYVAWPVYE
jgi:hypothetical protein